MLCGQYLLAQNLGEPSGQRVAFPGDLGQPLLELHDPPYSRDGHALVGHGRDLLDDPDLDACIAPLPPGRTLRRDDAKLVDAAQERLLDRQHLGDLPDGVQRLVLVIERFHIRLTSSHGQ
jgi:hypothetical protein